MNELELYRKEHIKIAKELCYRNKYIEKMKEATNTYEIDHIMRSARKDKYDDEY